MHLLLYIRWVFLFFSIDLKSAQVFFCTPQSAQIKNVLRFKEIKRNFVMLWPLSFATPNNERFAVAESANIHLFLHPINHFRHLFVLLSLMTVDFSLFCYRFFFSFSFSFVCNTVSFYYDSELSKILYI